MISMFGSRRDCAPRATPKCTREVPVRTGQSGFRLIGIGLIVLGLVLVFLALPFWLWAVLFGVVMILVGFFLLIGD